MAIISIYCSKADAVQVRESTLSQHAVIVVLTHQETSEVRNRENAKALGAQIATKMMKLAGIPESVTGKVAAVAVWGVLCEKYGSDTNKYAKTTPKGHQLTLKYRINLDGIRHIWKASGYADNAMPGSGVVKTLISIVNELMNSVLT